MTKFVCRTRNSESCTNLNYWSGSELSNPTRKSPNRNHIRALYQIWTQEAQTKLQPQAQPCEMENVEIGFCCDFQLWVKMTYKRCLQLWIENLFVACESVYIQVLKWREAHLFNEFVLVEGQRIYSFFRQTELMGVHVARR